MHPLLWTSPHLRRPETVPPSLKSRRCLDRMLETGPTLCILSLPTGYNHLFPLSSLTDTQISGRPGLLIDRRILCPTCLMMPAQVRANLLLSVFPRNKLQRGLEEPVFFLVQSQEGGRDLMASFCRPEVVGSLSSVGFLIDNPSCCFKLLFALNLYSRTR